MDVGHAHRPVVVGVDGSASAYQAVEWAAVEAARRKVELRLVRAFSWTTSDHPTRQSGRVARYRDQLLDVARHQLARAARIRGGHEAGPRDDNPSRDRRTHRSARLGGPTTASGMAQMKK